MRKFKIFYLFIFSVFLFSCVRIDNYEWNKIKDSEHIEDILDYAVAYTGTNLKNEINQKIQKLIDHEKNTGKLSSLIEIYPEIADDFKDRISEIAYNEAIDQNTYFSYESYIENYTGYGKNTAYINEARSALKNMYFNAAKEKNSIEILEEFIQKYKNENISAAVEAAEIIDDICWETAINGGSRSDYENYIEKTRKTIENYEGKHIKEAEKKIEDSEWASTLALCGTENIILPLKIFTDSYPNSEYIEKAVQIMTQMQNDPVYSEKYLSENSTLDSIEEFIKNFPGHMDIDKAVKFKENFIGDMYSFIEKGYITVKAVGDSIMRSRITIENRTNSRLIIKLFYGFYLASESGRVQNMLINEEAEISVDSNKTRSIYLDTLCMDIYKDIPDKSNYFELKRLENDSPLTDLLKILDKNKSTFEISQAAVWHITDDPGREKILNTIIYQDGTDAITEEVYNEAMRIIDLLNLN